MKLIVNLKKATSGYSIDGYNDSDISPSEGDRLAYRVSHESDPDDLLYIPLNRLHIVYQTELATDWDKVQELIERMELGEALPPVIIGYEYDVHDGHHRLEASKKLGYTHAPCEVRGANEMLVQAALDRYRALWKSMSKGEQLPKVQLDGMDKESAALVHSRMNELTQRFPEVQLQSVCTAIAISKAYEAGMKTASGAYDKAINSIVLNTKMLKKTAKTVLGENYTIAPTLEGTLVHEFAHPLNNYLQTHGSGTVAQKMLQGMAKEYAEYLRQKYGSFTKDHLRIDRENRKQLSRYATYSEADFFAEAFTEYILSKNPRPIAKEFGRRLELALRGVRGESPTKKEPQKYHLQNILSKGGDD